MKSRLISALILLLVCVPILVHGETFFIALILLIGLLSFKELYDLRLREKNLSLLITVLAYLAVSFLILNNYQGKELTLILDYRIITFINLAFLLPLVIIGDNSKYNLLDAMYLIGTILFIGLSFNLMIIIRNYSLTYFIYYLIIAIFTDTFALATGKLIGKHKLAKEISPNKTWEGFFGGLIMGTLVGTIYYLTVISTDTNIINIVLVTLVL